MYNQLKMTIYIEKKYIFDINRPILDINPNYCRYILSEIELDRRGE